MSTTSIHVTLPKALKEHVDQRVVLSPDDYIRALVRADRNDRLRREDLLRDVDEGLADVDAGRVYDGDAVFQELLADEKP